jgi:anti-sigma B factor antagonist
MTKDAEPVVAQSQSIDLGGLTLRTTGEGDAQTVVLAGEMDLANSPGVERELKRVETSEPSVLVIDLSALGFVDSSGVRVLIDAHARAAEDGRRLVIRRPPGRIMRILSLGHIDELLEFAD